MWQSRALAPGARAGARAAPRRQEGARRRARGARARRRRYLARVCSQGSRWGSVVGLGSLLRQGGLTVEAIVRRQDGRDCAAGGSQAPSTVEEEEKERGEWG